MTLAEEPGLVRQAPQLAALVGSAPDGALDEDRARGVLLGLAVGNLLGLPVEGGDRAWISDRFPDGVREIDPLERERALDDDLAQAVELAEALAHDVDPASGLAERLVGWRAENGRGIGIMTSRVIDYLADGLGVPGAARRFWQEQGSPETQPNGALMRCAAAALRHALEPEALIAQTAATCAVTHFAIGAQWSCILVNAAIAMLLRGGSPRLGELTSAAERDGAPEEFISWLLAISDDIDETISGEPMIGHTYLCMQAALWCLNCDDTLEEALIRIVSAGGDTDTNGAVAGAVLGARYGASAIPQRWLDCVPAQERIASVTEALIPGR